MNLLTLRVARPSAVAELLATVRHFMQSQYVCLSVFSGIPFHLRSIIS